MFDEKDPRCTGITALYRYFGECGDLLYVGISNSHAVRHDQHFQTSRWMRDAAFCSVEYFPTREIAEWAEAHVIASEVPSCNAKWPDASDFCRVGDMWFFEGLPPAPVGKFKKWFYLDWPETPQWIRRVRLVECEDPQFDEAAAA